LKSVGYNVNPVTLHCKMCTLYSKQLNCGNLHDMYMFKMCNLEKVMHA